jgi:hypothetical protein
MFNKVSRKILFAVLTLPTMLLFTLPLYAEEANLDPAQLDQTSDLIRQADTINETDMSQVHVDNGDGQQQTAPTQLSEQEREVYQHAQEQFDQEQAVLSRNTKHQDGPSIIPSQPAPSTVTAENNHSVAQVDDDIEKYRVEAQSNDRLVQEN